MVEVGTVAYCKMVLHAIKYPHCAVRGVLLGRRGKRAEVVAEVAEHSDEGDKKGLVEILDAIPALHTSLTAPPIETLFIHLDAYCAEEKLSIVGLYFANQLLSSTGLDELWARVALDKLGSAPVLLQIDNSKLSANANTSCLRAFEPEAAGGGKWRSTRCAVEDDDDTITLASAAVQGKLHRSLVDFENHLDDPLLSDFYNTELGQKLISLT